MQIFDPSSSLGVSSAAATGAAAAKPKARKKKGEEAPPAPADSVDIGKVASSLPTSKGNQITPLLGGQKAADGVLQQLSSAKESIQVEMYRLGYDKIIDVLAKQAQKGVDVTVLLDPTPGYDAKDAEAQTAMRNFLKSAGVKLLTYPIHQADKIDHVKLLIVDGKSAVIGGLNWDSHSPKNLDLDVIIEGPAVKDLSDVFANDWKISGGDKTAPAKPAKPVEGGATVKVATTEEDSEGIRAMVMNRINSAKKSIRMFAFALADKQVLQGLVDAKQRGVDVKVLLDPNKPIAFVNQKSKKMLEEAGIEVRYLKVDLDTQEKMHAKAIAFDDDTTILGSANFTNKGLTVNHEANVEVIDKALGTAMSKFFDDIWDNRSVNKMPDIPDFQERADDAPSGEQTAHELFSWYNGSYHPDEKRNWVGKRKEAVLAAFEEYSKKGGAAPAGAPEEEQIGALAAFLDGKKIWELRPEPGSTDTVWETRLKIAKEANEHLAADVPRYKKEMVDMISDPKLKGLLSDLLASAPEGFSMAPSSSTGKYHPADETRVVDLTPRHDPPSPDEKKEYHGGGLVLHSRRNMEVSKYLCEYYGIEGKERDEVLMAQALHDICKFVSVEDMKNWQPGQSIPWGEYTTKEHGHVGSDFVKALDPTGGKLSEHVRHLIDIHMGAWNFPEPTPPKTNPEKVMSIGDYLASARNWYVKV